MALLSQSEIDERLKNIDGWEQKENQISKKFTNKDFVGSLGFVTRVAVPAEKAEHHPDILIEYKNVTLTLSTHSEGGLTEKDFKLAGEIEAL